MSKFTIGIGILFLAASLGLSGTDSYHRVVVDWEPCKKAIVDLESKASIYNAHHFGGPQINVFCFYPPHRSMRQPEPEKHYQLTPEERATYLSLDAKASAAFKAESAYEELLIRKHGLRPFNASDECPNSVSIRSGDDFITEDPNLFSDLCQKDR